MRGFAAAAPSAAGARGGMPEDLPTSQMSDPAGESTAGAWDSRLLAPSAAGARGGTHEDLPTSQMSDPKGSELAGTQGFEPR